MAGMNEKYDAALLGILQNEGQIAKFLETVFGFLYRRTDFYLLMKEKDSKLGFPPGVAANIAFSAFKKYETLAVKLQEEREAREKKKTEVEFSGSSETPPVAETVEVASEGETDPCGTTDTKTEEVPPAAAEEIGEQDDETESKDKKNTAEKMDTGEKGVKNKDNEDDGDPELTRKQKVYQANSESYNGAMRDNYSWSQMITDVDVRVKVPKTIAKGKDVRVVIQKKHLKVSHRDGAGWLDVIDDDLAWDINKEESMWTLIPGEHIHVNLEKIQERWWESLIISEEKINVRKIDASRPMTDLDDEAQAKIQEMMFNERQKQLGLPQTHEMKVHSMLEKAWDAEGSPFKGQKFDPSQFTVAGPTCSSGT